MSCDTQYFASTPAKKKRYIIVALLTDGGATTNSQHEEISSVFFKIIFTSAADIIIHRKSLKSQYTITVSNHIKSPNIQLKINLIIIFVVATPKSLTVMHSLKHTHTLIFRLSRHHHQQQRRR